MGTRRTGPTKAQLKNRRRPHYEKEAYLNLRHIRTFKNLLRRILDDSSINEDFLNAFIANVITKGSRGSLKEAKDYVRSMVDEGVFEEDTSRDICKLLDRNRKYR